MSTEVSILEIPQKNKDHFLNYQQWSSVDGITYLPSYKSHKILKPGVYEIIRADGCPGFKRIDVKTDGLIRFPQSSSLKVIEEIEKFWEKEKDFKENKIVYKRGILLWGPQGCGKSSIIQILMQDIVKRDGLLLKYNNSEEFLDGIRVLRQIQPNTKLVVLMEDLDALLDYSYKESEVLNMLDGIDYIDNVVFLATTNYPEKLDQRIINRPSRFDKRFHIGFPDEETRRVYIKSLITPSSFKIDVEKWVKDTRNLSVAHIKELFVAVMLLGDKYEEALENLKNMQKSIQSSDSEIKKMMGFGKHD